MIFSSTIFVHNILTNLKILNIKIPFKRSYPPNFGYEMTNILDLNPIINSYDGKFSLIPHKIDSELSTSYIHWCPSEPWCSSQGL